MSNDPKDMAQAVSAIRRIRAVPALLQYICQTTGLGCAALARITDGKWVACAVEIASGLGSLSG